MKREFLFGVLLLFFFQAFSQSTYTSSGTGNWTAVTWTCTGPCGSSYPGQSLSSDTVVVNSGGNINLTAGLSVASVAINDAKLTISGAITFNASSMSVNSTSSWASLQVLNQGAGSPTVNVTGSVTITKNSNASTATTFIIQGSAGNVSTSVVTISGDLTYDYKNANSISESSHDIRVGLSGTTNDTPSLIVSGDVKMTYNYSNTTGNNNLSLVADSKGTITMNNLALLMKEGGTGTTLNYITTNGTGSAAITINGNATMDYQPVTSNVNCANYIQPGGNNSSSTGGLITINGNLIMKSNQNNGSSNNFAMVTGSTTLEIFGDINFQKFSSSVENRVELRHKANLKLHRDITPLTDGSFNFNSNSYNGTTNNNTIYFLGSTAQSFPKNFSASGGSKYDKVVIDNSYAITHPFTIPNATFSVLDSLVLKNGLITSTTANQLIFENTAKCNGGTTTSFVTGPIKKLGNGSVNADLIFPTGYDAGSSSYYWAPLQVSSIASADATTTFTAEYLHSPFSPSTTDLTFDHISKIEYWNLSYAGTTKPITDVTFYWKDARVSVIGDVQTGGSQDLYIARYNGTLWNKLASSIISPSYDSNTFPYTGSIMTASESTYGNFTLASNAGANILPVTLSDFKYELIENGFINLKWITETEINCYYFVLMRSFDGQNFYPIDSMVGAGTTAVKHSYNSVDKFTMAGHNYYRLINVDFDGQRHPYDKTISAFIGNIEQNYAIISPNPIRNSKAVLHVRSHLAQNYGEVLRVFDLNGKETTDKFIFRQITPNEYEIDSKAVAPGMYFLMLPNVRLGQKFVVE